MVMKAQNVGFILILDSSKRISSVPDALAPKSYWSC